MPPCARSSARRVDRPRSGPTPAAEGSAVCPASGRPPRRTAVPCPRRPGRGCANLHSCTRGGVPATPRSDGREKRSTSLRWEGAFNGGIGPAPRSVDPSVTRRAARRTSASSPSGPRKPCPEDARRRSWPRRTGAWCPRRQIELDPQDGLLCPLAVSSHRLELSKAHVRPSIRGGVPFMAAAARASASGSRHWPRWSCRVGYFAARPTAGSSPRGRVAGRPGDPSSTASACGSWAAGTVRARAGLGPVPYGVFSGRTYPHR